MKHPRHWLYWFVGLGAVLALAAIAEHARAQPAASSDNYGLILQSLVTPPVNLTTSRSLTAADAGIDITNTGSSGTLTLPVTPGMPVGTVIEVSQTALHDITLSFSGGEGIMIGTTAPASTISAISNGGTTTGSTFRIRKETSTTWFLKYYQGSVG
jgi:hypothetical protein